MNLPITSFSLSLFRVCPRVVSNIYRPRGAARRRIALALSLLLLSATMPAAHARSDTLGNTRSARQAAGSSNASRDRKNALGLEPGKTVERALAGGKAHSYRIALTSGQFLRVSVAQRGVDVVVALFGPDGEKLFEVNDQGGTQGQETVSLVAEASGSYLLEVRAAGKKAAAGRYEARIEELREATPQDSVDASTERTSAAAMPLSAQRAAESVEVSVQAEALPPQQTRTLLAHVEFGSAERFPAGSMIIVKVIDTSLASNQAKGTVRITSASTGFDTGAQTLTFSADGGSLYYHWPTLGLQPANDYLITATVNDTAGQWTDSIQLALRPHVTELLKRLATAEDLYLHYMEGGLRFTRQYRYDSSYFPYKGSLGHGWTHGFGVKLVETTDGYLSFFDADGSGRYYRSAGGGVYESAPGDPTRLTRDPDGTFQLRLANGDLWRFRSDLRLDAFQDRNSNKVSCGYDSQNRLTSLSALSGQQILLAYDAENRITHVDDSTGKFVDYVYDQAGDLRQVKNAFGGTITYLYDDQHRLTQIVFPDRRHRFFSYDANGRLSRKADDGGANAFDFTYDTTTGEQTITDALGRATKVKSNEAGQPTELRDGLGNVTRFQYDTSFRLNSFADGNGNTWQIIPDARGNPARIINPEGHEIIATHSADFNQITSLTDGNGNQTLFEYDETGDLTKTIYADGLSQVEAASDVGGTRTIQRKLRSGQTITYVYDARGLLTKKMFPDNSTSTYTYDSRGNLTSASNEEGIIAFEYDALSRLAKATYPGDRIFSYVYDQMSRLSWMKDPDGRELFYSYDEAGNLKRIRYGSKRGLFLTRESLDSSLVQYQYNLAGQPTLRTIANGVRTEYAYDGAGRLASIINRKASGEVVSSWTYLYDAANNRVKKSSTEGDEVYTYDKNSQLVSVRYSDGATESYEYDPLGNRRIVTTNGAQKIYASNSLNQYTQAGNETYHYNLDGNLTSKDDGSGHVTLYEHDVENRLTLARLPTGETISYGYDALGRLASRTTGGVTSRFLWDRDQIAIEEGPAHSTTAFYSWGRALDEAIGMSRGGKYFVYLQDALLSVTELTDDVGNVAEKYRYQVFGEPTNSSSVGNPFLFAGAIYESRTALFNMRLRWYSPAVGRFIQPDPTGISGGVNLNSYVHNDPINYSDPFGRDFFEGGFHMYQFHSDVLNNLREGGIKIGESGGEATSCPTFIQLSHETEVETSVRKPDSTQDKLVARIDVPVSNALLRSDIPVFGVASGKEFKEYRVEYGDGTNPDSWHTIAASTTPQPTNDVGIAEMKLMQGDIDIRGNLATWNTGLKEWVHLPWHPADDPTDFNGTYTIRLVVTGKDGRTVEDRVTCEVGRVVAQVLPGTAISTDRKVMMSFQAQSIQSAFRVYTIKPLNAGIPALPEGQELVGPVYTIREPGDRFMKPVVLRFDLGASGDGRSLSQLGIFGFEPKTRRWELLPTVQGSAPNTLETTLHRLPEQAAYFAVLSSRTNRAQSEPVASAVKASAPAKQDQAILAFDDFEKDTGEWAGRDREFGATVARDRTATPNGTYALKITNQNFGGDFAATIRATPFQADTYPLVSFDYKINPLVKTDFYVRVGQTWYDIGFTDDENGFKHRDVGVSRIGQVEAVIADGKWHSASFDLDRLLSNKTGRRRVEEIIMADWDVGGYMKLDFGRNARGATLYIDNFKIRRGTQDGLASDVQREELLVDDFDAQRGVNKLGGPFDVFSDPATYNCIMSLVPAVANGKAEASADGARASNHTLSLKYDVNRRGSYSGWWSQLQGVSIEDFERLAMKVKLVSGSTNFTIGLKNSKGVEVRVPVDAYLSLPDGTGWREMVIPLTAFKDVGDRSSMAVYSIAFTEAAHSGKGEVLIDDLKFQKGPLNHIRITDFEEDTPDTNRLMQKTWTFAHGAAAVSANLDGARASKPKEHCLRLSFGGSVGLDLGGGDFSYAAWVAGLGGVDASGIKYLRLKVKGQTGGEKPNLYLADGTTRRSVDLEKYSTVTTGWQDVSIPLEDFARQGVDLTHLEELQFVFEWEAMSGTIYIDDIRFGK